ncbi:hypothetical protein [Cupriavidus sp. YR651]|uniref:hypothetical protein n=1 Tax=Cupriavidus sp. YR651 TaxID=1855315 RepID=UPI000B88C6EA|nr:hypothetical protein [Cupriavidus sp. YR651]
MDLLRSVLLERVMGVSLFADVVVLDRYIKEMRANLQTQAALVARLDMEGGDSFLAARDLDNLSLALQALERRKHQLVMVLKEASVTTKRSAESPLTDDVKSVTARHARLGNASSC